MYELMVVGRTDSADSLFSKVEKMIKDAKASDLSSEKLGKKTLAYPIKKQTEAEYFVFNFEAPGEYISNISDGLRLDQENVLRYIILTVKARSGKIKDEVEVEKKEEETKEPGKEKKVSVGKKDTVKVESKSATVKEKKAPAKKESKSKKK